MSEDTKKKARESLYDLVAEEALVSHLCTDHALFATHPDYVSLLTGERAELASVVHRIAMAGEPITDESLRLDGQSEELRLLFSKVASIPPQTSSQKVVSVLRDISARREVAAASSKAYAEAISGTGAANDAIEALEASTGKARAIMQGASSSSGGVSHIGEMDEILDEIGWRVKNPGTIQGLHFGMPKLEMLLDGLQGSKLYLLGARPSVGKTAYAGDITKHLCEAGIGTLFFSCEMSKPQVQHRLIANLSGVNPKKSLHTPLTKSDLGKIRDAAIRMKAWNLYIDDTDRIGIDMIRSRARKHVLQNGVKVIIVDYIQLVRGIEPKSRNSKKEEVGEVSGALKALCKELDVPIVALAQLRRTGQAYVSSSNQTEIPKPSLESLKESGDLEQDADAVILLHRNVSGNASEACAIVAKNRSGSCGEVDLEFANDTTSFQEANRPAYHTT